MNCKKLKVITLSSLLVLVSCGAVKLGTVTNINYENGILSFDSVDKAEGYNVKFTQGDEVIYEDKITDTSIDIDSLNIEGEIEFEISAYKGETVGEITTYSFEALATFGDVIFEAENYLANYGTGKAQCNYRNNASAHNGAYVGGIDDAGQGIYINYLCPVAGTYTFESWYTTDMPVAHDDVLVNGVKQARYDYTEQTGWGGSTYDATKAEVQITLNKGWNTISVYKNGDESDNYGSFVELDYFVLKGTNEKYSSVNLIKEFGSTPEWYRLEAEMGSPRKYNSGSNMYECKNAAIVEKDGKKFSNGFILGGIEHNFDGIEWQFNSPVKGKYQVKIAYASGEFDGSKLASPSFVTTQAEVGLMKSKEFLNKDISTISGLPYTGWDSIQVAEKTTEITLEEGKNFIYCLLLDQVESGFFQVDYIDIKLVSEL